MKFGTFSYQVTDDPVAMVDFAVKSEELGLDQIWLAEHHGIEHQYPDGLSLMAATAMRTERIELCAQVMIPLHNPYEIAERGAIVDRLSGGRLVLALGQGYAPEEFGWYGVDIADRLARFRDSVTIIKRLWEEERVDFEGDHFTLEQAHIQPRPVQKPRPPVWILGWAENAVRRAARLSDAWSPGPSASLSDIKSRMPVYREALAEAGVEGAETARIPLQRFLFVAETEEEAIEEGGKWFLNFFRDTYLRWPHPVVGATLDMNSTYEEVARDRFMVGTPDQVSDEIARWNEELGVEGIISYMHQLGSDSAAVNRSLELYASEVAPRFRSS
jgi:alkanesulfonate monooxygenase SsuD/methylene tetrahydromethanopterin reductase-like flavin-dependent oxidoreductase (luciferase family)